MATPRVSSGWTNKRRTYIEREREREKEREGGGGERGEGERGERDVRSLNHSVSSIPAGGVIFRGILEAYPTHNITFIALAAPMAGQYGGEDLNFNTLRNIPSLVLQRLRSVK